jgi:cobyrinic acid a,c-diamide synthase
MTQKLTLGYRRARAAADSVLTREGESVRGHEFHRTTITPSSSPAWRLTPGADDGHAVRNVLASYLHVHWAGHPAFAYRFARTASTAAVTA